MAKAKVVDTEKKGGGNFDFTKILEQVEKGNQVGVIVGSIEMGTHEQIKEIEFDDSKDWLVKKVEDGATVSTNHEGKEIVEVVFPARATEVALVVDLPNCIVDYGDKIGKKPYRLLVNYYNSFSKTLAGFENFLEKKTGKYVPNSKLAKVFDAAGVEEHGDTADLLGKQVMVDVRKKVKEKDGKTYINVSCGAITEFPKGFPKQEYDYETFDITLDSISEENVYLINKNVRDRIKLCKEYEGSEAQRIIELFEAGDISAPSDRKVKEEDVDEESSKPKKKPTKKKSTPPPVTEDDDDFDNDIPF